jgi:hypothetical protein
MLFCVDNLLTDTYDCGTKGCAASNGYASCNP